MLRKSHSVQPEITHDLAAEETAGGEILMLEDEGDLTATLKEYLEGFSYKVTCVKNGVEGLKKVMAHDYDVILCDMLMPSLPGDKFFIAVQKVKPHLCNRFIFMTGHTGDRKIDEFIRSVHGVMMWKPFQAHELLETVRYIMKRGQSRR